MKRLFLTLLLLIVCAFVNGQIFKCIGIKAGLSIANQIWYNKTVNSSLLEGNKTGFSSAMSLEFLKSKYLRISTDIGYCQKGEQEKTLTGIWVIGQPYNEYTIYQTRINYISLNTMLKIDLSYLPLI